MSNSDFLFSYLPSFYQDFMVDSNGNNLLSPIFDIYYNAIGDSISQAQQISLAPYLQVCNPIILEFFSTIDVTIANKYQNGYIIDNSIVNLDGLFLDGNFTKPILGTFQIQHNITDDIRYIVFSTAMPIQQTNIFIQKIYKDKKILQNIWGNLLNYSVQIPDYNTLSNGFIVDFNSIQLQLTMYQNQLIALLYGLMNGPTIKSMVNGSGIFLGLQFAPFNGTIIDKTSTYITIESTDGTQTYSAACNPNAALSIGSSLNQYDLLEQPLYSFYDILSNPAAFTQILLSVQSEKYLTLLNIDQSQLEQYAFLKFDSTISFDDANIYWDTGNGTGLVKDLTGTTIIQKLGAGSLNRFDSWVSPLFQNQKLYEMFRNLFIVYINNSNINHTLSSAQISSLNYYLNRIKPIWTKFLVEQYP